MTITTTGCNELSRQIKIVEQFLDKKKHLYPIEKLMAEGQVATILGMSISWLQHQRLYGDGIPYIKVGRSVRYSPEAVLDYLKRQSRSGTSAQEARNV